MIKKFLKEFIPDNTPLQNFIFLLGLLTVIIIWIDLSSELAKEKDEIGSITAIFENADEDPHLKSISAFIFNIHERWVILPPEFVTVADFYSSLIHNKAPPSRLS